MRDIMLDLETLSLDANATVLSIGAVQFDLHTGKMGNTFHIRLPILPQVLNGSHIDQSTLDWWNKQDITAKDQLIKLKEENNLDKALIDFNTWIKKHTTDIKNTRLWGNGVTADNVWIRNLYKRTKIDFILPYWSDTDVRTLTQLEDYDKVKSIVGEFNGIKHDAISDCKYQIALCHVSYKLLKED